MKKLFVLILFIIIIMFTNAQTTTSYFAKTKQIFEKQNFLIGGFGIHTSQLSIFGMIGSVKNFGYYGKLKTNLNFEGSFRYSGASDNNIFFSDKTENGRYSITFGGLYRPVNLLTIYTGLGYGSRWLNWETISGSKFRVLDFSHQGIEFESGFIYKLNRIFFNFGLSTNSFQYLESDLGIGIIL